jgi:hypothetical protein
MSSRFDRPGPDSDVDDWYLQHGRFMQSEPAQEIPTGERECQDCHELAAASGDQMFESTFFCWRCWQQRILRTGAAIRRAKALETVEKP